MKLSQDKENKVFLKMRREAPEKSKDFGVFHKISNMLR
jgi:hypothetical protein